MFQPAIHVHKELKTKTVIAASVMGQSEMSVFGVTQYLSIQIIWNSKYEYVWHIVINIVGVAACCSLYLYIIVKPVVLMVINNCCVILKIIDSDIKSKYNYN
jgi:hypothetical protein